MMFKQRSEQATLTDIYKPKRGKYRRRTAVRCLKPWKGKYRPRNTPPRP